MGSCYAEKVIELAKNEIGYEEGPNNWNKYAEQLDAVHYFNSNKQNVSWCGVFCYAMILNACIPEDRSDEEKKWDAETAWSTAIHESGHTYINVMAGEKPSFVTIVSRGGYGGYMSQHQQR